jgi:hypothetical protein
MTLDLFAGIPVRDYNAAVAWYERLLVQQGGGLPGDEVRQLGWVIL